MHSRSQQTMQFTQTTFVVEKTVTEAEERIVVVAIASSFSEIIPAQYVQKNHNAKSVERWVM